MQLSFNGIINHKPDYHYPFIPVTHMIRAAHNTIPMVIVEDRVATRNFASKPAIPLFTEHPVLDPRPGIFATALAHEVRNPLTNINLATEILDSDGLNEEQKLYVDIIKRGVERIDKLVNDFLMSHKNIEARAEACSINELLDEVLEVNKDRILLKTVRVIKLYTNEKPEILVNRAEIKIALINVIVNAIEALPAGHGTLTLSTGTYNEKCTIIVEDNGIGITEQNLKNIFNPYYTNKPGGMGLGLSTTQDILSANCGTLDVKSNPGTGSQFTFYFNKIIHS